MSVLLGARARVIFAMFDQGETVDFRSFFLSLFLLPPAPVDVLEITSYDLDFIHILSRTNDRVVVNWTIR